MKSIFLIKSILLLSISSAVFAEANRTGIYLGGTLGGLNVSEDSAFVDFEQSGDSIGFLMGYNFQEWFGVEGHLIGSDHQTFNAQTLTIQPKFTYHANDNVALYTKFGVGYGRILDNRSDDYGFWDESSGYGIASGVGVDFSLSKGFRLRLAYDYLTADMEDKDGEIENFDADFQYFSLGFYYQR